ncbi:hypothetical protein TSUD_135360 [Trifolium subterraneum]|uniref:CCHC-type domain-containing protein n=1 Tax=Trifolium subterraneum TaxID=3900 RepID=A0A2Z6NRK3_TRISU|nr:hypothetical protein TSUD_135360 [Trifolium subterraneum]
MECKTTKEIWETLQTHHEGTNSVKETRIDIEVRKFELFEMKEEETIDQMYGRFTSIINELNSLGKTYTTHERIRKILRCLPKTWRPIVTAITVAKDLTKVSLEDLIGSLKAHESILQEDKPKNKMISLETQSGECSQKDETLCENEESLQEDDEEELAFLSRRIQRLMTRRNQLKKNFQPKRNGAKPEVDMSKIQCYGCNQYGHYKNDCLKKKQKKRFLKKKSMMATWDDLEEAQSEDKEQEANVCLMTHSNTEEVTLDPCSSCQKTEHLFDNLLYDTQILNQKNAKLRDEITVLTKERDEYKKESSLKSDVIKVKVKLNCKEDVALLNGYSKATAVHFTTGILQRNVFLSKPAVVNTQETQLTPSSTQPRNSHLDFLEKHLGGELSNQTKTTNLVQNPSTQTSPEDHLTLKQLISEPVHSEPPTPEVTHTEPHLSPEPVQTPPEHQPSDNQGSGNQTHSDHQTLPELQPSHNQTQPEQQKHTEVVVSEEIQISPPSNHVDAMIHDLHELRQSDMPSSEYVAQWVSLTEDLVKKLHNLQKADVEERRRFDKGKDKVVEEVIQNQKDTERNHPESSTVRDSNLNEPTQENLRSNQEHLRNPVYEAEIEEIKAKMDKYIGMIEEVN